MNTDITVMLVDDENVIRKIMREMMESFEHVILQSEAESINQAMQLLSQRPVDVIISDIQMEGGTGFDLARKVHELYPDILIVFLTGHTYFALQGYEYGPIDFLVKPVTKKRLEHTFERIQERLNERQDIQKIVNVGIQLEDGYRIYDVNEIAYIEKENRKVKIVSKNGSIATSNKSMTELEEMFIDYGFFRCHQSYIVPLCDIAEIRQESFGRSYKIILKECHEELPLSRRKYYEIKDVLLERGITFF